MIDSDDRIHRITAPKREAKQLKQYLKDYFDPQKVLGYSRKKRKLVMKYPRRTFWKKYWMARNKKKKLNNNKTKIT